MPIVRDPYKAERENDQKRAREISAQAADNQFYLQNMIQSMHNKGITDVANIGAETRQKELDVQKPYYESMAKLHNTEADIGVPAKANLMGAQGRAASADAAYKEFETSMAQQDYPELSEKKKRGLDLDNLMKEGIYYAKYDEIQKGYNKFRSVTDKYNASRETGQPTQVAKPDLNSIANEVWKPGTPYTGPKIEGVPSASEQALGTDPLVSPELLVGGVASVGRNLLKKGATKAVARGVETGMRYTTNKALPPGNIARRVGYAENPWRPY